MTTENFAKEWQLLPDSYYFDEIDSVPYREGNSSCIRRTNPYQEDTKEHLDWYKGYYNAYWGYQDYLHGAGDW